MACVWALHVCISCSRCCGQATQAILGSQEAGLRTYLLAYGAYFHSLSLDQLCQMFELPEKQARPCSPLASQVSRSDASRVNSVWGRASAVAEAANSQPGTCTSQPCLLQSPVARVLNGLFQCSRVTLPY